MLADVRRRAFKFRLDGCQRLTTILIIKQRTCTQLRALVSVMCARVPRGQLCACFVPKPANCSYGNVVESLLAAPTLSTNTKGCVSIRSHIWLEIGDHPNEHLRMSGAQVAFRGRATRTRGPRTLVRQTTMMKEFLKRARWPRPLCAVSRSGYDRAMRRHDGRCRLSLGR